MHAEAIIGKVTNLATSKWNIIGQFERIGTSSEVNLIHSTVKKDSIALSLLSG